MAPHRSFGGSVTACALIAMAAPLFAAAAEGRVQPGAKTGPDTEMAQFLDVSDLEGTRLFSAPLTEGGRWCLLWNHSVAGFPVRDCYRAEGGQMLLERSHQPDFAAGLGHIPGRGEMRSDGNGGYWIEAINEPVQGNCYRLRLGEMRVNHRIILEDGQEQSLSALAARQAVRVSLRTADDEGTRPC